MVNDTWIYMVDGECMLMLIPSSWTMLPDQQKVYCNHPPTIFLCPNVSETSPEAQTFTPAWLLPWRSVLGARRSSRKLGTAEACGYGSTPVAPMVQPKYCFFRLKWFCLKIYGYPQIISNNPIAHHECLPYSLLSKDCNFKGHTVYPDPYCNLLLMA